MKRREFISLLGGAAAAWPLTARAQQGERMHRVGVLMAFAEDDPETTARVAGFRHGLERLGWSEGRNVRFDYRFARGSADQFQPLAKELVALQPDVILAQSTPVAAVLQRETRVIPIVFINVSDPIGSGFIASVARPGGNLTGLQMYEEGIAGKWFVLLKEIAPRLTRAAFIANPKTTAYDYFVRSAKVVASSLAIELSPSPVETAADIERVVVSFARLPDGCLILPPDTTSILHRHLIVTLAAEHRLPAAYFERPFVIGGGLISHGPDIVDQYRRAAGYVDRILKGEKPGDLPVQAPTKYELVINLKTASALGLEVPPTLLARADEVIE
jgi:putative tryptophan/tyrosine transport system substrate-binding protein